MNKVGIIGHAMLKLHVAKQSALESKKVRSSVEEKSIFEF